MPALKLDPLALAAGTTTVADALAWIAKQAAAKPVLVYSSDDPAVVRAAQDQLGRGQAGAVVEMALAEIARALVAQGFTRLLVAGGETSGAAVNGLGVTTLEIGPEIDPGVPWTKAKGAAVDGRDLVLALKSGNFGAADFFTKAWAKLA